MGQYLTEGIDGQRYSFKIKGETPSPTETARIQAYLSKGGGPDTAAEPQAATTPSGRLSVGESMARNLQKAGKSIAAGGTNMLALGFETLDPDNPELMQQVKDLRSHAEETSKEGAAIQTDDMGFMEAMQEPTFGGKVSEGARSLFGTLVQSAPAMVAGAVVGGVTKSPALAVGAGSMFSIPQAMDSNVRRQIQEHGQVTDWNKAGLSAIMQGGIENVFDLPIGRIAGLFGRPARLKEVVDNSIKKAWSEAYKKTGKGISTGALTNILEEVTQQGMERWQADLPLLNDEAKAEYLENALVGGILGSTIGGVAGVAGGIDAYSNIRNAELIKKHIEKREEHRSAMKDAMDDADADAAAMRAERTPTSSETYGPKPVAVDETEEDHSAPAAEAAAPLDDSTLPPGLREEATVATPTPERIEGAAVSLDGKIYRGAHHAEAAAAAAKDTGLLIDDLFNRNFDNDGFVTSKGRYVNRQEALKLALDADQVGEVGTLTREASRKLVAGTGELFAEQLDPAKATKKTLHRVDIPKVSPSLFSEADYRKSVEALRPVGTLSEDRVTKTLKLKKDQARILMDEMIRRQDARVHGRSGKYAKLIVPKANEPAATVRDFSIEPVLPENHAPFFAEMNGKRRSQKNFQSEAEALDWIATNVPKNQQKSVVVAGDKSSIRHGVFQTVRDADGKVNRSLISSHDTETDAKAALKELNPAYSAITNEQTRPTPEAKRAEVERDVQTTLGPYNILQNMVDRMVGANRVGVDLTDRIDDRYMASKGHKTDIDGAMVEGVFTSKKVDDTKKIFQKIISLANLTDTNLSRDQRDKRIADTLNHEIIHAIVNLRLLTTGKNGELTALFNAAMTQKVPGKNYTWAQRAEARNPDLRKEGKVAALLEEGVAEMFRHYVNDPATFKGEVRTALAKIADFIRKLIGLGRKHDAKAVMDAIFGGEIGKRPDNYGGLPPRDQRDVWFSLLKPDNFYLKSLRVLENSKLEKATAEQWMATFKNAGVKQEELWWQNIEGFLSSYNRLIPKQELMNFIKGTPDVRVNYDFPNPKIRVNLRAGNEHSDIPDYVPIAEPKYDHMQTKGGTDYAEATFFFTPKDDEPDYRHSHWDESNVLAHVRFKTINEMGEDGINRKVLFIEEMQSDLHQQASKLGGYYSETLRNEANDLHLAYEEAAQEYNDHYRTTREEKNKLRNQIDIDRSVFDRLMRERRDLRRSGADDPNHRHHYLFTENTNKIDQIEKQMSGPKARHEQLSNELKVLRDKVNERQAAWKKLDDRMWIPNAPYRTSWEDYVIRRMIRHAAEHDFDAVAWHGQQESVNEAETWGGITETIEESPVETESWRPLPKTYKVHGDTNVTPIVNRYLEKLPKIVRELAQRFGATLDINDASPFDAAAMKAKGSSYTPPSVDNVARIEIEFPERKSIARLIDKLVQKHDDEEHLSSPADKAAQEMLIHRLRQANQVVLNQREFKPATAFHRVGLIHESPFGTFEVDFDAEELQKAMFWAHGRHTWSDTTAFIKGAASFGPTFPWKHFRLNLSTQMREDFTSGDVARFSMLKEHAERIEADPRFEQWFHGSTVVTPDGKPKVVYRFTQSDQPFSRFNRMTHFGTAAAAEERWNKRHRWTDQKGSTYPVFLNLRRPLRVKDVSSGHTSHEYAALMKEAGVISDGDFRRITTAEGKAPGWNSWINKADEQQAQAEVVRLLEKAGYDSFEYINSVEDKGSISYIAIRPEQIKSIFNPELWSEDPNIMYSKLEERGRDLWQNDDKFKSWFSGSRVVDEDGNPYLMFHGRSADFDIFDQSRSGESTGHPTAQLGFFFTAEPTTADIFAGEQLDQSTWPPTVTNRPGANLIPAFLSIKNPYRMTADEFVKMVSTEARLSFDQDTTRARHGVVKSIRAGLIKAGYDGIHIKGNPKYDEIMGGEEYADDQWVAFHPNQIKSALSTEFSAESDSFKFSKISVSDERIEGIVGKLAVYERERDQRGDQLRSLGYRPYQLKTGAGIRPEHYDLKNQYTFYARQASSQRGLLGRIVADQNWGEPKYMATAPLGTRVPPGPTPDRLEEILRGASYNNTAPVLGKMAQLLGGTALARKLGLPLEARIEGSVIQLQDHMQPLGKQVDLVRKNGGTITNENDPYLQQALMTGKTEYRIEENNRKLYLPLMAAIRDTGATVHDAAELKALNMVTNSIMKQYPDHRLGMAETILYALHAIERNAQMARRNEKAFLAGGDRVQQYEAGSGMSDFEAQQIIDWFASKPFGRKFTSETDANSVRSRYRALIANTKWVRVDGGLTPDFSTMTYASGPKAGQPVDVYKDYAPLRGFLNDHPNSMHDDNVFAHTGLGFNIRGKEDKSATGRATTIDPDTGQPYRSLGANLIATATLQNQEAITRAEKNKVDQAFYKMIKDNPASMGLVAEEITHTPSKWTYDAKTGNVMLRPDPKALEGPDILKFKIAGNQKYLKIADQRIAHAMGTRPNLSGNGFGEAILRGMRQFNKWFAIMVTSLNPEFLWGNWQRDMTTALVNMSEYGAAGDALKTKLTKSIKPAFQGIRAVIRKGDTSSEWAKNYMEFQQYGGKTSFQGIPNLDDSIRTINKDLMTGGNNPNYIIKALKATGKFIEDYNLAVENTTRLAAYVTLRDHFLSLTSDPTSPANIKRAKEQAAFAAKRMTVDFNMGGESKYWLNGLYVFYGAAMNGTTAIINPIMRSRKMQKIVGSIVAAGMTQEFLNALLQPEDENGDKLYDKLLKTSPYILEHNMVFIDPFGISERGYFKIPMPYGFNGFYNFGRATGSALRGEVPVGEAANSAFGTLVNAFNPLGEANNFINFVAPTVLDPVVDLWNNENYAGVPIAPPASPYGPDEVASQRYWNNTAPFNITIADQLSRLTGRQGDFLPGYIEVSPNQLGFLFEFLSGGLGATTARVYNFIAPEAMLGKGTVYKLASGDFSEVDANDIPFLRRNIGNVTTKNDLQTYIKDRDKVLRVRAAIKDANKEGDSALAKSIREKYKTEIRIGDRVNAIENARKKLSKQINKIRDSANIPNDKKQELIKKLKERQDKIVGIGNRVMQAADIL